MGRKRKDRPTRHPEFAKRFIEACAAAGIKGAYAKQGKKFGVSATTIGNWIHGDKLPSMEQASKIALILNVSLDWLINGKEAAPGYLRIEHLPHDAQVAMRAAVGAYSEQEAAPIKENDNGKKNS